MDTLLKIIALLLVFQFAGDFYAENKISKQAETKGASGADKEDNNEEKKTGEREVDFYIRALGDVEESDLKDALKILKDFYNFRSVILPKVKITKKMKVKGTDAILNADESISELSHYGNTVFIADKRLWHISECKGFTDGTTVIVKGDKSIMKETLLHEIGHTLGLSHCNNLSCIMAINNDEEETGKFRKCRKKADRELKNRRRSN